MPSGEWLDASGHPAFPGLSSTGCDPLGALQSLFERSSDSSEDHANPATRFSRAYVGYLGWDLIPMIDKVQSWGDRVDLSSRATVRRCDHRRVRRTLPNGDDRGRQPRRSRPDPRTDRKPYLASVPRSPGRNTRSPWHRSQRERCPIRGHGAASARVHLRRGRIPDRARANVPSAARRARPI